MIRRQSRSDEADYLGDGFWDGPAIFDPETGELAAILDGGDSEGAERETVAYMGEPRPPLSRAELDLLAAWAEQQACLRCRFRIRTTHDPEGLRHDHCRKYLRISRILDRYT